MSNRAISCWAPVLVVLTVMSGILLSGGAAAANVLANPGFETPDATAGDVPVTAATSSWAGFGGAFITQVTEQTGAQSFKAFGNPGGAFQDFAASPGELWTGTVFSQNFSGDPLIGQQGTFINIEWIGPGGQIAFLSTPIANSTTPTDTWIEGTVSGVAPAGTTTARLVLLSGPYTGIGTGAGGAGFFDNATFSVIPEPASAAGVCLVAAVASLRRRRA